MVFSYDDYGDTVLYDVFYEAGTYYGGVLSALQDEAMRKGDGTRARQLLDEQIELQQERQRIDPNDRTALISCIEKWHARARECDDNRVEQIA